jgi:hypothetical protein
VDVDERDAGAEPAGATVGGRPLPHVPLPREALRLGLGDEADHW